MQDTSSTGANAPGSVGWQAPEVRLPTPPFSPASLQCFCLLEFIHINSSAFSTHCFGPFHLIKRLVSCDDGPDFGDAEPPGGRRWAPLPLAEWAGQGPIFGAAGPTDAGRGHLQPRMRLLHGAWSLGISKSLHTQKQMPIGNGMGRHLGMIEAQGMDCSHRDAQPFLFCM